MYVLLVGICSSPTLVLALGRWVLHRRYDVSLTGAGYINPSLTYLIVPNHPAIVDPLIVVTELHRLHLDVRPLVDESFFTNRVARHILDLLDAVRVPDFRHLSFRPIPKTRPSRRDSVSRARSLVKVVFCLHSIFQNQIFHGTRRRIGGSPGTFAAPRHSLALL